jgi:hypothetical protein
MAVSLNEDNLGFSATEVFIPNIIICGAVAIRLTNGFAGIHFTPVTQAAEITVAAEYAAKQLAPLGGSVLELVFFVNEKDFGEANVKHVTDALSEAFKKTPKIIEKPTSIQGEEVDLWLHAPADTRSTSWIGVRPHTKQTPQPVTPSPNVFKINTRTKPPTIIVAPVQNLPGDAGTMQYKGTYVSI